MTSALVPLGPRFRWWIGRGVGPTPCAASCCASPPPGRSGLSATSCVLSSRFEREGLRWRSWTKARLHGGPHVQHRAAEAGDRDLHQVRPERGRHHCRARLPDKAFAQGLVQGLSGARGGQASEAATGAQVHLGDEAGCRGLLSRAREEPRQDHALDGLSRRQ